MGDKLEYARRQRSRFKFGQHLVTFSFYIYAGIRGKAALCWIWATSTMLKAVGRTSGKWQQFGFGSLEYIRTGCVAKLGTTTEKRGHPAEVLTNLSIVYTSCVLEGEDTPHHTCLMSQNLVQYLVLQELVCIVSFWGSYSEPKSNLSQRKSVPR